MSKFVKDLIVKDLRNRLSGVEDALLVDVIGLKNDKNVALRQRLRKKNIQLLVVKNSLARRAAEGTRLERAFDSAHGTLALIWGGEDIISLAKEVVSLSEDKEFKPFTPKGGVMDGQPLAGEQVTAVSRWPSRKEQLSILSGQILNPGATLSAQLLGAGSMLASQVKKKSEGEEATA
ncbi:MAG: 50S ribosomal protein L10 [Pirellulales bacterium]|nr:50S ribosomal protein L10 [Pirellulales bacterium]